MPASDAVNGDSDLVASFRQKANFMRSWKPGSAPSVSCIFQGVEKDSDSSLLLSFANLAHTSFVSISFASSQNRDKLELYALHKQSISGDALDSLSTQSAAERAKYQACRNKVWVVATRSYAPIPSRE